MFSPRTFAHTLRRIENIKKRLGDIYLKDITNAMINTFYNELLKNFAPATANNYLARLKRIFSLAVELEFISISPIKIKKKIFDNTIIRFFRDDEKVRLLEACKYDEEYKMKRSAESYNLVCLVYMQEHVSDLVG